MNTPKWRCSAVISLPSRDAAQIGEDYGKIVEVNQGACPNIGNAV